MKKVTHLVFHTAKKCRTFLSHSVSPFSILLHKFATRFSRIAAGLHFKFIRKAKSRIKHIQSFFYKLKLLSLLNLYVLFKIFLIIKEKRYPFIPVEIFVVPTFFLKKVALTMVCSPQMHSD